MVKTTNAKLMNYIINALWKEPWITLQDEEWIFPLYFWKKKQYMVWSLALIFLSTLLPLKAFL